MLEFQVNGDGGGCGGWRRGTNLTKLMYLFVMFFMQMHAKTFVSTVKHFIYVIQSPSENEFHFGYSEYFRSMRGAVVFFGEAQKATHFDNLFGSKI